MVVVYDWVFSVVDEVWHQDLELESLHVQAFACGTGAARWNIEKTDTQKSMKCWARMGAKTTWMLGKCSAYEVLKWMEQVEYRRNDHTIHLTTEVFAEVSL